MQNNEQEKPPIGSGHVAAMGRLGLQELRNVFYNGSNVAQQQSEYGLYGKHTPGEVAASRQAESPDLEEERGSTLAREMERATNRESHEREPQELERE